MVSIDYPRLLLVGVGLVTVLALVVAASTSTTAFGVYNQRWDGAAELRELAEQSGADAVIVRNSRRYETVPATDTVAVILSPDAPYSAAAIDRLE